MGHIALLVVSVLLLSAAFTLIIAWLTGMVEICPICGVAMEMTERTLSMYGTTAYHEREYACPNDAAHKTDRINSKALATLRVHVPPGPIGHPAAVLARLAEDESFNRDLRVCFGYRKEQP